MYIYIYVGGAAREQGAREARREPQPNRPRRSHRDLRGREIAPGAAVDTIRRRLAPRRAAAWRARRGERAERRRLGTGSSLRARDRGDGQGEPLPSGK